MIRKSLLNRTSLPISFLCDRVSQLTVRGVATQQSSGPQPCPTTGFPGFLLKEMTAGNHLISRHPQNHGINMPQPGGSLGIPLPIGVPLIHRIPPSVYESPSSLPKDRAFEDPLSILNKVIEEDPGSSLNRVEKQAARLIVIRRSKMNKHKLKKLRKKMKYVWAKVKLRRKIRKEKAFLNSKMVQIREALKFDAKAYVAEIIRNATEKPFPTRWRGRWLPEPLIREKLEKEERRNREHYLSVLNKRVREN